MFPYRIKEYSLILRKTRKIAIYFLDHLQNSAFENLKPLLPSMNPWVFEHPPQSPAASTSSSSCLSLCATTITCATHSANRRWLASPATRADFSAVEEEFADVIIRITAHTAAAGCRVGEALEAKITFNRSCSHGHGGKAF